MVVALGLSDRALHVTRDIAQILVAPAGRPVRPEMLFVHGLSRTVFMLLKNFQFPSDVPIGLLRARQRKAPRQTHPR